MIGRPDRISHLLSRRRGKHVTNRTGIQQSFTDIAGKHRQMSGAATGDDTNLALCACLGAGHHFSTVTMKPVIFGMGGHKPGQHFIDIICG